MKISRSSLVAFVVLLGCSSGADPVLEGARETTVGSTTTTSVASSDEVVERADAACAEFAAALDAHRPFPFDDFDPYQPDPAKLPLVGAYFAEIRPAQATMIDALEDIEADGRTGSDLALMVEAARAEFDNAVAQQEAAMAGDEAGFVATLDRVVALGEELDAAAQALGATRCVIG